MAEAKPYTGGCHCGRVRYEVTLALDQVYDCNCSLCTKLGALWAYAEPRQFRLISGEDALTGYRFNKKMIHHLFCSDCGIESFGRGPHADGTNVVGINVRCLDGIDLGRLTRVPFDGKSL
jgi:hypothetical protein